MKKSAKKEVRDVSNKRRKIEAMECVKKVAPRHRALSLFASAGVAETYFSEFGVDVCVASELLPQRAKFHEHLYPEALMIEGDITDSKIFRKVLENARRAKCDFILATPPCQGMSTAGSKKKDDPRNRLIIPVVDAIIALNPKFVIIENVPELLQTEIKVDNEWVLIEEYLHSRLDALYLFNDNNVVNAMHYGVPQSRERCVFLLTRRDLGFKWEFPSPSTKIKTMRDAIGNLPSLDPDVVDLSKEDRDKIFPEFESKKTMGLAVSKWHYPPRHYWRHVIAMMHTPEGHSAWENLKYYPTLKDGRKSKGYKNTYKRQWWDKPAYTVTMFTSRIGSQENGHPGRPIVDSANEEERLWSDARTMTIYELMLLSSLPHNWRIPDWASSNVIREIIGEGVPPRLLAAALNSLAEIENV
jgi:DNA (cytosine-5)-methyltransferase 1